MTQENKQHHDLGYRHAYLECVCADPSHTLRVELDVWQDENTLDDPSLSLSIQLNPHYNFFQRCLNAFRYVFGFSKTGWQWDPVELDEKSIDRLQSMVVAWNLIRKARRIRRAKKLNDENTKRELL